VPSGLGTRSVPLELGTQAVLVGLTVLDTSGHAHDVVLVLRAAGCTRSRLETVVTVLFLDSCLDFLDSEKVLCRLTQSLADGRVRSNVVLERDLGSSAPCLTLFAHSGSCTHLGLSNLTSPASVVGSVVVTLGMPLAPFSADRRP
jgi:hypothetical protein